MLCTNTKVIKAVFTFTKVNCRKSHYKMHVFCALPDFWLVNTRAVRCAFHVEIVCKLRCEGCLHLRLASSKVQCTVR